MRRLGTVLGTVLLAALAGCGGGGGGGGTGGGGNAPPVAAVAVLGTGGVSLGGAFQVQFTLTDPDSTATASLYVDADGSLVTTGDRTLLAPGLAETGAGGTALCVSVGGVAAGTYALVVVATDGTNSSVSALAPTSLAVRDVGRLRSFGGTGSDIAWSIAAFSDGSYVVGGGIASPTTFGPGEPNETTLSPTTFGGFIAKYAADDSLAWARLIDGSANVSGIAVFGDGSLAVSGGITGAAKFGPGEAGEVTVTGNTTYVARYASSGAATWVRALPAGAYIGPSIAAVPDGSVAAVGVIQGTATLGVGEPNETTLTANGGEDIALVRFASDGSLMWAKRAGSDQSDEWAQDVAYRMDGSLAVVGKYRGISTFGAGEPGQTFLFCSGYSDAFVAEYRLDGTLAWAKRMGGIGQTGAQCVLAFDDDSIVVTGTMTSSVVFGPGEPGQTTVSGGQGDLFLARFSSSGDFEWARRGGNGGSGAGARDLQRSPCGDIVLIGYSQGGAILEPDGPDETTLAGRGAADGFVARYSAVGSLLRATAYGGAGEDSVRGAIVAPDDSVVLVGHFAGTCFFGDPMLPNPPLLTAANDWDGFVVRVNGTGTP